MCWAFSHTHQIRLSSWQGPGICRLPRISCRLGIPIDGLLSRTLTALYSRGSWPDTVRMPWVRWPSFRVLTIGHLPQGQVFPLWLWDLDYAQTEAMCSKGLGKINAILRGQSLIWEAMEMIRSLSHQGASWSLTWGWGNNGAGVGRVWWVSGAPRARWRRTLDGKQNVCQRKQEAKPQRTPVLPTLSLMWFPQCFWKIIYSLHFKMEGYNISS